MGYSWAFVGTFTASVDAMRTLRRALPAQKTASEDIRDTGSLHDRAYSKAGLAIRRLSDGDEYAELLADVRRALAKVAIAGAEGEGDLVGFVDAPARTGIHFRVAGGEVHEGKIATAAVEAVRRSKPYRALVARHEEAFDEDDESGNDVVNVAVREAILARVARLSDEELIAAARATKLEVDKGSQMVPLHALYARPSSLRKALEKGGKEWCDAINSAPLLMVATVDENAALLFARRIIDEARDRFDPLKRGALTVLSRSAEDEDFDRVWRVFDAERKESFGAFPSGMDDLLRSNHPRVEGALFTAFREELGESPDYRMPWDDRRSGPLARVLYRRGHAEAVRLIEEASRLHPWKHYFVFEPSLLGNRDD